MLVESDGDCGEGGCGGRSFVVFGRRQARDVVLVRGSRAGRREVRSLNGRRPAGYSIDAVTGYDNVGSGGDFDGDGRDDLLVAGWEYGQGTAVVYGTRATVRVPANPSRRAAATRILHTDSFGRGVGPVGEVTGDGLADVLVTEERIGADGDSHESLVLLPGRRSRATINPRRVTPPGGRLALPADTDLDWYGPLGDVNGDGLGDYAVQADLDDDPDQLMRTYVILGSRQGPPARLDALGAAGFVIR